MTSTTLSIPSPPFASKQAKTSNVHRRLLHNEEDDEAEEDIVLANLALIYPSPLQNQSNSISVETSTIYGSATVNPSSIIFTTVLVPSVTINKTFTTIVKPHSKSSFKEHVQPTPRTSSPSSTDQNQTENPLATSPMHISPPPIQDNHHVDNTILENSKPNSETFTDFVESIEFMSLISKPLNLSYNSKPETSTDNLFPSLNSDHDLEPIDETFQLSYIPTSNQAFHRTNIYENAQLKP